MPFQPTPIPGLLVYEPKVFEDSRGYFFEAYNSGVFASEGIHTKFVQDNQSRSSYGVIRGLHFQRNPHAQVKLVRAIEGRIYDVAVDLRQGSPTYGQSFGIELSADNKRQLYIPAGFAHGFSVLSEFATVMYKCDALYDKESEGGILYSDPVLQINWQVPVDQAIISDKDKVQPLLADVVANFQFNG